MPSESAIRTPLAVLGGTFDPVHYGHLHAADDVRRALGLTEVRLVPSGDPPHRAAPVASAANRMAMLELAVEDFPGLVPDAREIARTGKSYTMLTLEELRRENPGRPLLLLVGADAFHGLPTWHRWTDLFSLAHLVVVARPGIDPAAELPPPLAAEWIARATDDRRRLESPAGGAIYAQPIVPRDISSTAIRRALSEGPDGVAQVRGLLPPAVLAYIARNQLYRSR
jgi:nicotinate-nucleotide adenylyltransferase